MKRIYFLFLLFFPFLLISQSGIRLNAHIEPLLSVEGCVNVAHGDFFVSSDEVVIEGAEPLKFSKAYDSNNLISSYMGAGMIATFPTGALHSKGKKFNYLIEEEEGMFIPYRKSTSKHPYGEIALKKLLKSGITNTGKGHAHGRIFGREVYYNEDGLLVYLQDGTKRTYGIHGKNQFFLKEEQLPSGRYKIYKYETPKSTIGSFSFRVKEIALKSPDKALTFSTLNFSHEGRTFKVLGSNGQNFSSMRRLHKAKKQGSEKTVPIESKNNWKGDETYNIGTYVKDLEKHKIREWHFGNGLTTRVRYNKKGKVRSLAFGGLDPSYIFRYGKHHTDVYDHKDILTKYLFTPERRLASKQNFIEGDILYSTNHFYWYKNHERDRLLGSALLNSDGRALSFKKLSYDTKGNLVQERFYGNLTGQAPNLFNIDYNYSPTILVNCYFINREFSKDHFNNLRKESDNFGILKEWQYMAGTNLPSAEFTYGEGEIKERVLFKYDQNHLLTEKIIDDGSHKNAKHSASVTYRIIERYQHHLHPGPDCGLLSSVTKLYVDFTTGEEKTLSRKEFYYNHQGAKIEEKLFDANGLYYASNRWTYSKKRECTSETDALGRKTIFRYNEFGQKIREEIIGSCFSKNYSYDSLGRVIEKKVMTFEGKTYSTQYEYDLKGNKISEISPFGHKTTFTYDALGRLISETNHDGYSKLYAYDEANNVISKTDEVGFTVEKEYTAYGLPYVVRYPDGSNEAYSYTHKGELQEFVARDGSKVFYTYDYNGRKIKTEKYDPSGELLYTTEKVYKGQLLLYETDPMGRMITYEYDAACRKIAQVEGGKRTEYGYDRYGNQNEIRHGTQFSEVSVFDYCGREIETFIHDSEGLITERTKISYDLLNHVTSIQKGGGKSSYTYDLFNRPLIEIDPYGNKTTYSYLDGQSPEITTFLPNGKIKRKTLNWRGKPVNIRTLSPDGKQAAQGNIAYDPCGRKIEASDSVIYEGVNLGSTTYLYTYNLEGKLIYKCEQPHSSKNREHYFSYDFLGRQVERIKPDGTRIQTTYDAYGHLEEKVSSDSSVHFFYTNTPDGKPLKVENLIENRESLFVYDEKGNLISETQETGLNIAYSYDEIGRATEIILPDHSQITYLYKGKYLQSVFRNGKKYTYAKRDSMGRAEEIAYPSFSNYYKWDLEGRLIEVDTPQYKQKLLDFDSDKNLIKQTVNEKIESFDYDDLDHLTSENKQTYAWDSLANRRKVDEEDVDFNELNQMEDFSYDRNGRRVADTDYTYTYNALDQLVELSSSGRTLIFSYDHKGRRLFETEKGKGVYYFYLGEKESGRFNNGQIDQLKVFGNDLPLSVELDGKTYYSMHNSRGDLVQLLDEALNVSEEITYSAFGEKSATGTLSPWRFFCNRSHDQLVFYFFRVYDSKTGTWLTPDPIGTADGPNLYTYVKGNPIFYSDSLGLFSFFPDDKNYEKRRNDYGELNGRQWGYQYVPSNSSNYTFPGKSSDAFSITFINGMNSNFKSSYNNAEYLSKLGGGLEICGTHNASFGIHEDLKESCKNVLLEQATTPAWYLAENFKKELSTKDSVFHICHSQGTAHTKSALKLLTDELRNRIDVLAIAPSIYIDENLCHNILHLVSKGDFITKINYTGRKRNQDTIKYVGGAWGKGFSDHSLQSPIYKRPIEDWFEEREESIKL